MEQGRGILRECRKEFTAFLKTRQNPSVQVRIFFLSNWDQVGLGLSGEEMGKGAGAHVLTGVCRAAFLWWQQQPLCTDLEAAEEEVTRPGVGES